MRVVLGDRFAMLIAAAQAGDESAFELLWRDANPALVNYLRLRVGQGAEDVASDTWLDVVRGLVSFSGDEAAWRSWLFTIARRRGVDEVRRRLRQPAVPTQPDVLAAGAGETADSADEALTAIDTAGVLALVSSLPPAQAEIVLLRVVAGLPTDEVARIVGRTVGAVRVGLHRGLKTISDRVSSGGIGGAETIEVTNTAPDSIRTQT